MEQKQGITWDGNIGTEDKTTIGVAYKIWWIKLDNGQAAKVADVLICYSPFLLETKSYVATYEHRLSTPGIRSISEQNAFNEAVYQAGVFAGKELEFHRIMAEQKDAL